MMYYILASIALTASPALAYSTGAPTGVCDSLTPQHGGLLSQETPVPYALDFSSLTASAGQPISITLRGNGDADVIKGFILQARIAGKPVGQFIPSGSSQTIDCSTPSDTLTHKKIIQKLNKIETQWMPSADLKGKDVEFVATVVQRGDVFWVKKLVQSVHVA